MTKQERILRGLLYFAWVEMNAIRAESGVPFDRHGTRKGISEKYWSDLVDIMQNVLGEDAKPWPSKSAEYVMEKFFNIEFDDSERNSE